MDKTGNLFNVDQSNSDKKQLFIDATICSLAHHGYKGTTVRQIAKYAGVTPGLLTHYYEGKEVLIAQSYKYLSQRFLDDFREKIDDEEPDPLKTLKLFIENIFKPENMDAKYLRVWLAFWTLTLTEPNLREGHKQIYRQYVSSIETMLKDAYRHCGLTIDPASIKSQAIGINALLDGLWLECCMNPGVLSEDYILDTVFDFVRCVTGMDLDII